MKILKITAVVAIIALAIAYIASPYAAASGFSNALANYDANEASEYIDYPSVRQKIKDDMNAEIASMAIEESDNPFAAAGAAFAGGLMTQMIDGFVTPAGLEKALAKAQKEQGGNTSKLDYETEYAGMNRFLVRLTQKANGEQAEDPLVLVFERQGLFSWKLIEVDLPFEEFRNGMANYDT